MNPVPTGSNTADPRKATGHGDAPATYKPRNHAPGAQESCGRRGVKLPAGNSGELAATGAN
ncbi:hypothetical protein [Mobiluncus mulieris]|uniref:hypothetical protein n=1 Tax=Mobiluncus mulieris TaxID=2052 RepID=UPI0014707A64|nr:hypothetical protein [Mobiluncus mulieris]NMX12655.1 hypothetical protein [Mobiluncus mulieris]